MIEASMGLNRAMGGFLKVCENLRGQDKPKVCEIDEEARIKATLKFLKTYELCVRADESLKDIVRHKGAKEMETSLERTKELLTELTQVVKSYRDKEMNILVSKLTPVFFEHRDSIVVMLKQRPGARIWDGPGIVTVSDHLSRAIEELRKSAAYALLLVASPEEAEGYLGKLVC